MPEFQYTAREPSGNTVTGILTAGSEHEVAVSLGTQQLFPVQIGLAESAKIQQRKSGRRVKSRYLSTFYSQLSDLLRSGVPLLRSLELLERQTSNVSLKTVVQEVREDVADGNRLSEAMRKHQKVFSELAISMVRAGEEGSFLEDVLKRIAIFTDHQQELTSRVKAVMAYPIFLLVAGTSIVTAMLIWFVPKFEAFFTRLEQSGELPTPTVILMGTSELLSNYFGLLAVALVGAGFGLYYYLMTDEGKYWADKFKISAPGLGPVIKSLAVARFCRILGTLLNNGVPILPALRISKDATGNVVLSDAISNAADHISAGKQLAPPLSASGQFPGDVIEMIAVGEEANNLEQVLIDVAETMEKLTYRKLDVAVRLLEPAMLCVMAGLVLFVVAGLLLPVFKLSGAI